MEINDSNNKEIPKKKSILILGSGLVSEPVIDYLLKRPENHIILASNSQEQINKIISKKRNLNTYIFDIIKNKEKLTELVKASDLVISLIPPFLHIFVAKACLQFKKNLVTTSYISEEIKKMDKTVKENNLQFIFEIGISPGLDHMIAYKVIEEQKKQGNVIIGYESWCGAIPSPESIDNPLLYKFSWNPKGALMILKNDARQLINGKVVKISEKNLFTNALVDKRFHPSLNLEGYYNRDSIKYRELYNLTNAKSVIRGLIRYQGFTFIMQCFKNLNLLSFERVDEKIRNWRDFLNKILKNPRNEDTIYEMKSKYIKKGIEIFLYNNKICDTVAERLFYFNLALLAISQFEDKYIRKYGFEYLFNRIYSVLIYLDFYNENNEVNNTILF
jgi:alpha-aminoadipic semialdehyde synthase